MSKKDWEANHELQGADGHLRVMFSKYLSNVFHLLVSHPDSMRFIKCACRGEGDWLIVVGVFGEDGTPLVAFGSGTSLFEALVNVNTTISKGHWKADKYP